MSITGEHDRGLVVLSLDGGGIRGLSSLLILQELMTRLQHKLGLDEPPEVHEHFDIIGGTGTGGISAVMLGRLRMPLSQAINQFTKLETDVFSNKSFFSASKTDRSTKIQQALKSIIQEATGDEDEKMMDNRPDTERCKTVVFAMSMHNMNARLPRAFRSYQAWVNQMPDCPIWEALCATTAHPDLFESVNISDGSLELPFVDGGLGCNNPLPRILAEVKHMYPDRQVGCVISIGTGYAETIQIPTGSFEFFLPKNIIKAMKAIATDSEGDAQHMATRFSGTQDVYFRLNVDQGMQSVELHHWERMNEVAAHTRVYMQLAEVTKTIDRSVEAIKNKNCVFPAIYIDGQLPVLMNPSGKEQSDERLNCLLLATDAWYNSALSAKLPKRTACTANTRTKVLADAHTWTRARDAAKIYWMNGMAGTGKTTIAYTLCQGLEANKQLGASFFCSRVSPTCRDVTKLVPTIAYQLGGFSNIYGRMLCNVLAESRDVVHKDVKTQFENILVKPLRPLKDATPRDVVVVIDALDECDDVDATKQVLDLLFQHAKELPIKFFVTSRPEPGIATKMIKQDSTSRSILHLHDIEQSLVQADICTYLTEALAPIHPSPEQVELLTTRAGLLFIFAATVVRYINPGDECANHQRRLSAVLGITLGPGERCTGGWIAVEAGRKRRKTLTPHLGTYEGIDELYKMIISEMLERGKSRADETNMRWLVLWTVVCAREPMTMSALAELLDFENEQEVELAVKPLRSVLHISESTGLVSTLHASFPDFLLDEERAGSSLYCPEAEHSAYLATRCFEVMKRSLQFNICQLETSCRFDKDVPNLQTRVNVAISMGLFYACRYWGDHLLGAAKPNDLALHIDEFLRNRLLFWTEVLSLKGWIGHGEGVLSQVLSWLPTDDTSTTLREFTYDARNFVTTFAANPTSLSTPHIYLSALPFTSNQSHVRSTYWPRTRGMLRIEGTGMEARGGAALATWNVGSKVKSIAQSGDGKRIVSGCEDGTVSIWDVSKGARIVGPLKSDNGGLLAGVEGVAFSLDGTRIASSSWNYTIQIWDAHNGNPITVPLTGHTARVFSVAFSPDGTRLISGSLDCTIRMWDARNGSQLGNPFQGHQGPARSVAFSADGKRIASGSDDHTIRIWDVRSATTIVGSFEGHTDAVRSVAFSPDGRRVVSGSGDGTVRVWDVQSATILADPFRGHTMWVMSVAFSPDGTRVVSGALDDTIRIWNAQSGVLIARLKGHRQWVNSVLFSADGTRIFSGSSDRTICVWDARHGTTAPAESLGRTEVINSVAFSPDGTRVVSGSRDRTIRVWDTRNGRLAVGPLEGHTNDVSSVAFSPDGAQIVSGSADCTIRTWDARSGASIAGPFEGHTKSVRSVAYSPDGRCIVSASADATIRLWDSQTGKPVAEPIMGHTNSVESVAWSPDATRIVSGSHDRTVRMWNTHGTSLWTSDAHTNEVHCVAYSPDGTRIVSGSNAILVLNADDGTLLHGPFKGHTDSITSVAFSPDGTRIVAGSLDGTVCVLDAQNDTLVPGPLKGHTETVHSVAFSPDSRRVVSCSDDKTIRFWDVATADNPLPAYVEHSTLRDDGWMTDSDSQLFMWLPPDLRAAISPPHSGLIRRKGDAIFANYHDLLVGERWMECYRDSTTRTMA